MSQWVTLKFKTWPQVAGLLTTPAGRLSAATASNWKLYMSGLKHHA